MNTIRAIFENGVFRPLDPVDLPEGTIVEFEPRVVAESEYESWIDDKSTGSCQKDMILEKPTSPQGITNINHEPLRVDSMTTIHAVFEDGVFRPLEPVDLPNQTRVEFEPRLASGAAKREAARGKIWKILGWRFRSGQRDLAARHNEHQP